MATKILFLKNWDQGLSNAHFDSSVSLKLTSVASFEIWRFSQHVNMKLDEGLTAEISTCWPKQQNCLISVIRQIWLRLMLDTDTLDASGSLGCQQQVVFTTSVLLEGRCAATAYIAKNSNKTSTAGQQISNKMIQGLSYQ